MCVFWLRCGYLSENGSMSRGTIPDPSTSRQQDGLRLSRDALTVPLWLTGKRERNIELAPPSEIQTPNLPDGLTQQAITKVITDNNRSMKLCFAQSMKAGERLNGKMEVELTIAVSGSVIPRSVAR